MTATPASDSRWLFPPVPLARVAVLRTILYLFLVYDVLYLVNDVVPHGSLPPELYKPVAWPRLLDLPAPTPLRVHVLQVLVIAGALLVASGRLPGRWQAVAGGVVAVAYLDWVTIGMSYGKIDHDHLALVVALFALPTAGQARHGDRTPSEAAGFALRCIQVSVVATYVLAAWAKLRWGGWGWANGAVYTWAMTRRGTALGRALVDVPWLLVAFQWMTLVAEALSPLLLVARERWRLLGLLFFCAFHVSAWLTIGIHFLPTVVCLLAFLPLEELLSRSTRRPAAAGSR